MTTCASRRQTEEEVVRWQRLRVPRSLLAALGLCDCWLAGWVLDEDADALMLTMLYETIVPIDCTTTTTITVTSPDVVITALSLDTCIGLRRCAAAPLRH